MRHLRQVADLGLARQIFSQAERQARRRSGEFARFHDLAQVDDLAVKVGNLDSHRGLARYTLDEDGFRLHGQAEVVHEVGDAAVFDARFGLELVRGDDRPGVNLGDAAVHLKLGTFSGDLISRPTPRILQGMAEVCGKLDEVRKTK